MTRSDRTALQLEVEELTAMLRTDESFEALRRALGSFGVDAGEALRTGLAESEAGFESGAVVVGPGDVRWFERSDGASYATSSVEGGTALERFPAVAAGLELVAN